jgi:integrase
MSAAQLDMLASEAGRYRSLVLLDVGGLRWGEAIALRVCDVDFLRRRVELHRNVVRVREKFIVGSLKSNNNRNVVVPAFVMTALAATATGKGPRGPAVDRTARRLPPSPWTRVLAHRRGARCQGGR